MKLNPLILALDVEAKVAKSLIQELKDTIDIFKIGSRLFTEAGPDSIDWVHAQGKKVFLDLKFHDIPLTAAESSRNIASLGVWGFTIHTSGGFAMMKAVVQSVQEESVKQKKIKPFIFGVTVLTSLSELELKEVGVNFSPAAQVERLVLLAKKAELDGIVSSGLEIEIARKSGGNNFLIVVPGIRSGEELKIEDQKRVMTPQNAIKLGANFLVVGRPILEAKDRIKAAQKLLEQIRF
ncbi:MAG: orotidine-5'-phosphate decarboxylase [Elusimicrobia bacterium]|nr:orotidine-5'-phosphate decarboxylase [Elusimicrobiota bacterium]